MPSLIEARGFPVPEDSDQNLAKRPEFVGEAMAAYLTRREEPGKRHRRLLAKGVNHVAQAAFSPKTYIKALTADGTATGTNTGASVELTDLAHAIVSPIPATLWWDLSLRGAESGGVASSIIAEVKINGTIYGPRIVATVAANTTVYCSACGPRAAKSADGAFWINPQTSYAVTVHIWKGVAGATIKAIAGSGDTVLRVRVEPRLL